MSFASFETSRDRGQPVNLYRFVWGETPTSFYAYTDAEKPVIHDGITYDPIPVMRGAVVSSGSLDKSTIELRMPVTTDLSALFIAYPPSQVVSCFIRQGHLDDPDAEFPVIWTGRIVQSGREGNEAVFQGEPVATSMKRTGLRRHYQYSCPHVLYGPHCRANEAAATTQVRVEVIAGAKITLPFDWTPAERAPLHLGGMVRWTGSGGNREVRTILDVSGGTVLTLSGAVRGLRVGQTVDVLLGCNHQMSGCRLHNNIHNFGGCPWIPKKNPIGIVNNFY